MIGWTHNHWPGEARVTANIEHEIAIESGLGAPAETQRMAAQLIPLMYQDLRASPGGSARECGLESRCRPPPLSTRPI